MSILHYKRILTPNTSKQPTSSQISLSLEKWEACKRKSWFSGLLKWVYILSICVCPCWHQAYANRLDDTNTGKYQVEVILFKRMHTYPETINPEVWHVKAPLPLKRLQAPLTNYDVIPYQHLTLKQEAKKLLNYGGYQILLHTGWVQTIPTTQWSSPMYLIGAKTYQEEMPEIEGYVEIRKSRFFNLRVHMQLLANNEALSIQADPLTEYHPTDPPHSFYIPIDHQRRLRSHQLNYIDHPLVGMLIKIIPVHQNINVETKV